MSMAGPGVNQVGHKVEDYRPGYPRYTALLAAHPAFQNFRRFKRTRMRLLLLKQDEVTLLEESLDKIDAAENHEFFLGCSRMDRNVARQDVLRKLKATLEEYDAMMEQNRRVLSLPDASERDIDSLRNWVEGTCSISRAETAYLDHFADQLNVTGANDHAVTCIETTVEDSAVWISCALQKYLPRFAANNSSSVTDDENIFLLGPNLRTFSRVLTTWVATAILLVPVIVLYNISSPKSRLITIVLTAGIFLSIVSMFTKARTLEIIAAGASYAAVLVVFTSANNVPVCTIGVDSVKIETGE